MAVTAGTEIMFNRLQKKKKEKNEAEEREKYENETGDTPITFGSSPENRSDKGVVRCCESLYVQHLQKMFVYPNRHAFENTKLCQKLSIGHNYKI